MKKGEIWRVRLPIGPGHTQAGERPAIVVLVPFTSTQAAARFAGTLVVQPDGQNGLTTPSVALVFQLSAVDKRGCLKRLGVLDPSTLDQVFATLDQLTGR